MKYFYVIGMFFIIALFNVIFYIFYLSSTKLPGGDVGMVPFGMGIMHCIAFVVSSLIFAIINYKRPISYFTASQIYHVILCIVFAIFLRGTIDWLNWSYENYSLFIILTPLLVWIFVSSTTYRK